MWGPDDETALVEFEDRSWRLCRITGKQQAGDGSWLYRLRQGQAGKLHGGWYRFDPVRFCRL